MSYFHHFRGAEDPRVLLRRENQVSTPCGLAPKAARSLREELGQDAGPPP